MANRDDPLLPDDVKRTAEEQELATQRPPLQRTIVTRVQHPVVVEFRLKHLGFWEIANFLFYLYVAHILVVLVLAVIFVPLWLCTLGMLGGL